MKATFIPDLTEKERELLKKIYKKGNGSVCGRAKIILMATELSWNYSVAELAKINYCSRQTVYNIFARFNEQGVVGLFDKPRSGRPRMIGQESCRKLLDTIDRKSPYEVGDYLASKWTSSIVKDYIYRVLLVEICKRSVQRFFARNSWSYNRSKHELVPNAIERKTQKQVLKLMGQIDKRNEVLLFLDQSGFPLTGKVCQEWTRGLSKNYSYKRYEV